MLLTKNGKRLSVLKVVSVEQMQAIETAADADGITFDTMFKRVALAAASRIMSYVQGVPGAKVAILVGGGNNGGDGLVTALRLTEISEEIEVGVYLVKPRPDDDPKLQAVREAGVFIAEADKDQQYRVLRTLIASANVVVDAIFGIGLRLPLEGDISKIMRSIQQALHSTPPSPPEGVVIDAETALTASPMVRQFVLALDCPSGIDCDTGAVDKLAITADETLTFIAVKQGMLLAPAAEYVGRLSIATLGIPADLDELKAVPVELIDSLQARQMLPPRPSLSHKGTFGKVIIAAGSVNYTGAAGLAALGAYRSGAGLVTIAAPGPVVSALASQMLETTWVMLPHDMGVISEGGAEIIVKELDGCNAMLLGPGMGQEDTTKDMLLKLFEQTSEKPHQPARTIGFSGVKRIDKHKENPESETKVVLPPLVLDADALNLLAKVENWWEQIPANTILTPHPGEMARLCGIERDEVTANRLELTREKAAAWNAVVLLKGAHTVIAAPDGRTAVLPFKTSALATAGTGDVLAGIIVSLLAQSAEPFTAAALGGYLHGSAGVMASDYAGNRYSVMASSIADHLETALQQLML